MNPRGTPENLRRLPKGVSGNPGGRPKGLSLTRLVREELQKPTAPGSAITKAHVIAERIVNLAQAGDRVFAPLVWRYVDGEPKQSAEQALREIAEKLAPQLGVTADDLVKSFLEDLGAA